MPISTQNLMFDGVTTMSASKKEMSTKLHSKLDMDSSSLP